MTPREAMDHALKEVVVRPLRAEGFTGSLPHLRRRSDEQICLISFQFYSSGGSFVVEVAECAPDGFTTSWGAHVPPQKVKAQDMNPPHRPRLGNPEFPLGDHWFTFGPRNYEPGADELQPPDHYIAIATDVLRHIQSQAETFWRQQLTTRSQT